MHTPDWTAFGAAVVFVFFLIFHLAYAIGLSHGDRNAKIGYIVSMAILMGIASFGFLLKAFPGS